MNRRDSLAAALVALLWGFNFVVIDWGLGDLPPLLFAALRFALVAFPAALILPRPAVSWRAIAAVGAFMSLGQFGFLYSAMAMGLPAGLSGLVLQAQVVFTIVIATVVLRERPTLAQILGVAAGAVGLVVVALGRGGEIPLGALALCIAAALSWGIGNVVARAARVTGGLSLTVWSALVVPVPLVLLSLLVDGPSGMHELVAGFGWKAGLSTLYTVGLASFVGYGVFNSLLARHPASTVVPWILLVPPVAIVSAWLLTDEVPGPGELVGGGLLVAGALVAQGLVGRLRAALVRPRWGQPATSGPVPSDPVSSDPVSSDPV